MGVSFAIQAPFVSAAKFAEMTGQKESQVSEQMKNGQLPEFILPPSVRQKDPSSTRRKKFINLVRLYADAQEA
tara:strand:- start:1185 stop:1403 length:219 start_codon:yes stop_codon:yes gene_type:complete